MHVAVPSAAAVAADSLVRAADGIDSHELLRVRSFLDHNRPYTWLGTSARGSRTGESTGVFVYRGALLGADEDEENLVRHLRRWETGHRQAWSAGA